MKTHNAKPNDLNSSKTIAELWSAGMQNHLA